MRHRTYFSLVWLTAVIVLGVWVWRDRTATHASEQARLVISADIRKTTSYRRNAEQQFATASQARAQTALDTKQEPVTPAVKNTGRAGAAAWKHP